MKHIHADLMMQFAQDAMTTDEPHKFWQYFDDDTDEWKDALCAPAWLTFRKYRRKPQKIRIDRRVPKQEEADNG